MLFNFFLLKYRSEHVGWAASCHLVAMVSEAAANRAGVNRSIAVSFRRPDLVFLEY